MMQKNALQSLPVSWQKWVVENLANGCDSTAMVTIMERDGPFDRTLAQYALADAHRQRHPGLVAVTRLPGIDTATNKIVLPDRVVDVLVSLFIPRVVVLGNVLSDKECDAIAAMTRTRFARSTTIDNGSGVPRFDVSRTSESASIQRDETALMSRIDARLAALSGWPVDHGEPLQLQKYQAGNEYRPHFDWFDPALPGAAKHLEKSGQRLGTIILYLTDVEEGGATSFPSIGLDVFPQKGGALFFCNTTPDGSPEQKTLHAGLPVVKGTKIIANKWLREKPY
ncbi:2OG-Fe(II) oxygenase [Actimicrobium sp. CCI2.3]|uniref:2OG-Fe(II) oxygenase n=1 Tax=Actimicrobium sp. CCI2.3 TaxID=3048616 RepID=UPI002AB44FFB|nr:2OG-Fe(II) oxygenase [Actimicrobium sp. CCI2.3]MDY7573704.1 2OG-Fe(II) oxygenase [Actimicrobium sp. CCI2.3]MEB0021024.1 2OG-Fe(II) oxygenase [Actimicrobium sp. CCI2.3]